MQVKANKPVWDCLPNLKRDDHNCQCLYTSFLRSPGERDLTSEKKRNLSESFIDTVKSSSNLSFSGNLLLRQEDHHLLLCCRLIFLFNSSSSSAFNVSSWLVFFSSTQSSLCLRIVQDLSCLVSVLLQHPHHHVIESVNECHCNWRDSHTSTDEWLTL